MYLSFRFSILKSTHLHRQAGSCSTALYHSWHGSRFCRCQPAGIHLCTKRPKHSRSTRLFHLPRRRNPDVVAGQAYRTDLMGCGTKVLRSTKHLVIVLKKKGIKLDREPSKSPQGGTEIGFSELRKVHLPLSLLYSDWKPLANKRLDE